ncbi:hypothetical protein HOY82DRAFT_649277 [Tuber indicum]|nr:hypothetical protein HOY82DRAFT_649277 [Tuber indicum]
MRTPPMRDLGSGDDSEQAPDPSGSIKMAITAFPERTIFINPTPGDSNSIAITDTGKYSDGILRFKENTCIQSIPILLFTLKNIILVNIGTDHVNGLMGEGNFYAWAMDCTSNSEDKSSRVLASIGSPLACSAIVDDPQHTGGDGTMILVPTVVQDLKGCKVVQISTDIGALMAVLSIKFSFIGYGARHIIAISEEGQTGSLDFGGGHPAARGPAAKGKIKFPTEIENAATRSIKMVFSDARGQFPILLRFHQNVGWLVVVDYDSVVHEPARLVALLDSSRQEARVY